MKFTNKQKKIIMECIELAIQEESDRDYKNKLVGFHKEYCGKLGIETREEKKDMAKFGENNEN